jgi:PAS domain S-box-containing protein
MMGASKAVESPFWKIYRPFHFLGWRGQVALLTISMILVILGGGVYPLLLANKRAMTDEVLKRAEVLVNKLAMRNGEFIRTRQETNLDTASFLSEPGVVGAYLLSKELMILSPVEQRGKSKINDVSKGALRQGSVTMEAPQVESDGEAGTYHLAVPIRVWNGDTGNYENYGVAYLVFQARLVAEAGADVQSKFVVAAITISLVVLIFIALIALVTLQPLKALHEDAELVMRGDLGKIESRARWRELVALSTTLNRSFERYAQERLNHASSAVEPIVPAFVPAPSGGVMAVAGAEDARVEAISNAVAEGVLITDDMQRVVFMNRIAERLFGVPLSRVKNRHVMDVISNQEILGAVLDLFKQVINTEEKTVSTTVSVAEADGTRKLNVVMAGVKGASRQLEYAAIVIRR